MLSLYLAGWHKSCRRRINKYLLHNKGKLRVQKVVDSFLYYGTVVYLTILALLSKIKLSTTCGPDRIHNEKGQPFFGLHGDKPRGSHLFLRMSHGLKLPL